MNIRIAGVVNDSIVDGPGLRFAVFTQGCSHRCPGCHNPETHDPLGGHEEDTAALIARMKKNPLLSGITLTGGDPPGTERALPGACESGARAGVERVGLHGLYLGTAAGGQ